MRIHPKITVHRTRSGFFIAALMILGLFFRTFNANAQSAHLVASPDKIKSQVDACLAKVPTPQVQPGLHRVVQLVNCSNQNLLAAANAAQQKGGQPVPVLPESGSWVIKKAGSSNNQNVLTIDIPLTWEDTQCPANAHGQCQGIIGPRFWARTGCRYDLGFDKAQCETGGCAGRYDCSAARLSGVGGTTVSEWTFAQPVSDNQNPPANFLKDSPDISAVDGVNLNMDIEPVGGSLHDPSDNQDPTKGPHDIQWLAQQYPLTDHGQDVRTSCPGSFQLTRSMLTVDSGVANDPYGFVYVNKAGQPINNKGNVDNSAVACFSNCGRYEFPQPPAQGCTATPGSDCFYWTTFCLQGSYGQTCKTDSDCTSNASCWNNSGPESDSSGDFKCSGRAFVQSTTDCAPLADGTANPSCPYVTYQYGYTDTTITPNQQYWSTQPPLGLCSDVSSDPSACIGDDTLHKVMPKAYTWPNDPQVYGGDSPAYRVIFEPGGNGTTEVSPLSSIPSCSDLPGAQSVYGLKQAQINCSNVINYGALFGLAEPAPTNWGCDLDPTGAGDNAVICKWNSPARVKQIGMRPNFNAEGTSLQLSIIPPSLLNAKDMMLASITFNSAAGSPTVPTGWTQVPGASATEGSGDQTVVWYHFVTSPSLEPATYVWSWNQAASPSGGMTAWRGVSLSNPFDATAAVDQGVGATATAPPITTQTPFAQVISVYGAGNAEGLVFGIPQSTVSGVGIDETGALKIAGGPTVGSYYAHLMGDRIEAKPSVTDPQAVTLTSDTTPPDPNIGNSEWTAISFALKPSPQALQAHK